jgi:hypothetical protein
VAVHPQASEDGAVEELLQRTVETNQLSHSESPFELKFEIKHFGDKKMNGVKNEKLK